MVVSVTDPTHALYPSKYVANIIGNKIALVVCNEVQISIPISSTSLEYIEINNASKLTTKSVMEMILLAKELGVICP